MSNNNNGLWLGLVGLGVIADRPNIPTPPPGVGQFYIATDTGTLTVWNGSAWVDIATFAPAGAVSAVAFTELPATPAAGNIAYVDDLADNTVGATAAGAGTDSGLVVYDGANWIVGGAAAPV